MGEKKRVYQSEIVQHAVHCSNVQCLIEKPEAHPLVFVFETQDTIYYAATLNDAVELWISGGKELLVQIGSQ